MKREQRLHRNADFQRVRAQSPRGWPHPLLVLYAAANDLHHSRVGITVGRRVGKAVVRNRVRRRLREAIRLRFAQVRPGFDLVLNARPASATAPWRELCTAVDIVGQRAGLWRVGDESLSG